VPKARAGQGEQPGGPPGTEQGQGQGGDNGSMSLAERQEALRRQLEDQAGRLPGTGTEEGDEALRQLDEAGRAMDEAADALENGDIAGALDLQSDAMEAMREGMTALGRALAEEQGREPGQGQAEGAMPSDRPLQDPWGVRPGTPGLSGRMKTSRPAKRRSSAPENCLTNCGVAPRIKDVRSWSSSISVACWISSRTR
jgi:hypothetical protein